MFRLIQMILWAAMHGCLVCAFLIPRGAAGQEAPLPPASDVIDRYVEALGGRDVVLAPQSLRFETVVELPGLGAEGEMQLLMSADGRMVTTMTLPGMGQMESGYTGTVGWSMDAMTGPRLMEGKELAATRDQADPLAQVRDASLFSIQETVERTEMGGEPCYLVRLVWISGRESFDCYHVETGLAVASVDTTESPMGSLEVTTYFEEYEAFDGILVPVRSVQEVMGDRIRVRVTGLAFGDVEPAEFDPPAPVRSLIEALEGGR